MHYVTLIPGDGTGPEVTEAAVKCIEASGVKIKWEKAEAGVTAMEREGTPLPQKTIDSIKRTKVALKGPVTTPVGSGFRSVNVTLRKEFDTYACVRPCKIYEGVQTKFKEIDLVVIRENSEDLYAGIEFQQKNPSTLELIKKLEEWSGKRVREDSGISIKPISVSATRRIIEFAFQYAEKNNRKKVTAVHKANIMKYTDGLFLETAKQVALEHPGIQFEDRLVDNMAMQLVQKPEEYDVLALPNLYGDIISDLCAGLVGGLGVTPGANYGQEYAIFEAVHGSAPKYAGLNKVNPTALILSGVLLLKHLKEEKAAKKIENAVAKVIREGKFVTYDLKPRKDDSSAVGTREMSEAIAREIEKAG